MDHFAGLDVSVKETSVCIVDDTGRIDLTDFLDQRDRDYCTLRVARPGQRCVSRLSLPFDLNQRGSLQT
jgi:hypothetical protein